MTLRQSSHLESRDHLKRVIDAASLSTKTGSGAPQNLNSRVLKVGCSFLSPKIKDLEGNEVVLGQFLNHFTPCERYSAFLPIYTIRSNWHGA